jgi:hypothetical protein
MFHLDSYDHPEEDHRMPEGIYMEETLEDHQQDHLWDTHITEEDSQEGAHPEEAHPEEAHPEEGHQCHFPRPQLYQEDEMTS